MVARQPAAVSGVGEEALGNPPPGLDGEAFLPRLCADHGHGDGGRCAHAFPGVGAVGEAAPQEGSRLARGTQQPDACVAVVQGRRRHGRAQQTPVRVHKGVALAPDDAPGRVIAAGTRHPGQN